MEPIKKINFNKSGRYAVVPSFYMYGFGGSLVILRDKMRPDYTPYEYATNFAGLIPAILLSH